LEGPMLSTSKKRISMLFFTFRQLMRIW